MKWFRKERHRIEFGTAKALRRAFADIDMEANAELDRHIERMKEFEYKRIRPDDAD